MPPAQDTLGGTLKIIQIAFYTIGAIIAILTYRAAKRGLLNTVNTEYQKRVMDRMHKLSEDLYSEFDPSSPMYWVTIKPVHDAIQEINEVFENNKNEILAARKFYYSIPYTEDVKRLEHLLHPIPAIVHRAAQNDLKPSIGCVIRFTALWSCSTTLLRYLHCRMAMPVLWVRL